MLHAAEIEEDPREIRAASWIASARLTERGRALVDDLIRVHFENEAAIVSELTDQRRVRLAELLGAFLAILEAPAQAQATPPVIAGGLVR